EPRPRLCYLIANRLRLFPYPATELLDFLPDRATHFLEPVPDRRAETIPQTGKETPHFTGNLFHAVHDRGDDTTDDLLDFLTVFGDGAAITLRQFSGGFLHPGEEFGEMG